MFFLDPIRIAAHERGRGLESISRNDFAVIDSSASTAPNIANGQFAHTSSFRFVGVAF